VFYQDQILPRIVHWAMRQSSFAKYRQRLVPAADGRVLEIGSGSGLNLPFYSERANQVLGLDSSKTLLSWARKSASPTHAVMWLQASAEAIPLDDASVDTVLTTWTLCSIPDVAGALKEVRRVLKPSGRLLFVEHGRAQDANVSVWQDRLTPLWKRVAGGLSSESSDRSAHRGLRLPDRAARDRLYEGPAVDDVHVRRLCATERPPRCHLQLSGAPFELPAITILQLWHGRSDADPGSTLLRTIIRQVGMEARV
jgi:ubiquinone/menaquinone biosynthesis C-methylase UbiE